MSLNVILCRGLPGSGKSTWAKQQMAEHPGMYKRSNKDDLRAMLHNGHHTKNTEAFVLELRDKIIEQSLQSGFHVLVDDCNFAPFHEQRIKELVAEFNATFKPKQPVVVKIQDFTDVPIETCIANDLKRLNSVGEQVIRKMYNQYLRKPVDKLEQDKTLPHAIVVDIDGTLADMTPCGRSPYAWDRVGEDVLVQPVADVVRMYQDWYEVIIVSGRDAICRSRTEEWLAEHRIGYSQLLMRPEGDTRKDNIVKQEIYEQFIKGKYYVQLVLDDRDQVVQMWRSLGLTCFQVAEGEF